MMCRPPSWSTLLYVYESVQHKNSGLNQCLSVLLCTFPVSYRWLKAATWTQMMVFMKHHCPLIFTDLRCRLDFQKRSQQSQTSWNRSVQKRGKVFFKWFLFNRFWKALWALLSHPHWLTQLPSLNTRTQSWLCTCRCDLVLIRSITKVHPVSPDPRW